MVSSRLRVIGRTSIARRFPQFASDAIASPAKTASTTTSRNRLRKKRAATPRYKPDFVARYAYASSSLVSEGWASVEGDDVRLTRDGLLRVDSLLPRFFEPEHRGIRYT